MLVIVTAVDVDSKQFVWMVVLFTLKVCFRIAHCASCGI
jgi:hypothetical protein